MSMKSVLYIKQNELTYRGGTCIISPVNCLSFSSKASFVMWSGRKKNKCLALYTDFCEILFTLHKRSHEIMILTVTFLFNNISSDVKTVSCFA